MTRSRHFFALFIILVAAVIFASTVTRALFYNPDTEIPLSGVSNVPSSPSLEPTRLIIPKISVDTRVQHVGINAKGNMAVPTNFTDAGWYKYGVVPGGSGSAVIAGHVDNGLSMAGVFKRLADVTIGDELIVERVDGSTVTFVVTGSRKYPYDKVPTEIIFNPSGSPRLNLITCEGTWVKKLKTYDERLIVFTKLKES